MRESNTSGAQANDRVSPDQVRLGPPVFTAHGGLFLSVLNNETESQYQDSVIVYTTILVGQEGFSRRAPPRRPPENQAPRTRRPLI